MNKNSNFYHVLLTHVIYAENDFSLQRHTDKSSHDVGNLSFFQKFFVDFDSCLRTIM